MNQLHWYDQVVWIANAVLLWLLLFASIRQGLSKRLRTFTILVAFECVQTSCLIAIGLLLPSPLYFWSFYVGQAGETICLLLVLHEIFAGAFRPYAQLPFGTIARLCTTLALIAIGTLTWAFWNPASHPKVPWYADLLSTANRSVCTVVACALWSIVMYARSLGIPWRSRVAWVARGFLLYLSVQAITTAASVYANVPGIIWLNRIAMISYLAALSLWFRAAWQQDTAIELPTPETLLALRGAVAHMRSSMAAALRVSAEKQVSEE